MKLQELNDWLTLIANIGVLVGIIFLIIELNQNTSMMRASAMENRESGLISSHSMVTESEALQAALTKVRWASNNLCPEPSLTTELTETDKIVLRSFFDANWFRFRTQDFQYREGTIDKDTYSSVVSGGLRNFYAWFELFNSVGSRRAKEILVEFDVELTPRGC